MTQDFQSKLSSTRFNVSLLKKLKPIKCVLNILLQVRKPFVGWEWKYTVENILRFDVYKLTQACVSVFKHKVTFCIYKPLYQKKVIICYNFEYI